MMQAEDLRVLSFFAERAVGHLLQCQNRAAGLLNR